MNIRPPDYYTEGLEGSNLPSGSFFLNLMVDVRTVDKKENSVSSVILNPTLLPDGFIRDKVFEAFSGFRKSGEQTQQIIHTRKAA